MYWQESRIDGSPAFDDAARDAVRREFRARRRWREIVRENDGSFHLGSWGSRFSDEEALRLNIDE
jgi:hypothetical protein